MKQLFTLLLLLFVQLAHAQQTETFLGGAFRLSFIEQGQSEGLQTFSNSERSSFELELRPYLYREKPNGSGTGYGLVLGMQRTTRSGEDALNRKNIGAFMFWRFPLTNADRDWCLYMRPDASFSYSRRGDTDTRVGLKSFHLSTKAGPTLVWKGLKRFRVLLDYRLLSYNYRYYKYDDDSTYDYTHIFSVALNPEQFRLGVEWKLSR